MSTLGLFWFAWCYGLAVLLSCIDEPGRLRDDTGPSRVIHARQRSRTVAALV